MSRSVASGVTLIRGCSWGVGGPPSLHLRGAKNDFALNDEVFRGVVSRVGEHEQQIVVLEVFKGTLEEAEELNYQPESTATWRLTHET